MVCLRLDLFYPNLKKAIVQLPIGENHLDYLSKCRFRVVENFSKLNQIKFSRCTDIFSLTQKVKNFFEIVHSMDFKNSVLFSKFRPKKIKSCRA